MSYKRKPTRPMRAIEETETTRERDHLQQRVDQLKAENLCLKRDLTLKHHEAEMLLHHKVLLANELRSATQRIQFLTGGFAE